MPTQGRGKGIEGVENSTRITILKHAQYDGCGECPAGVSLAAVAKNAELTVVIVMIVEAEMRNTRIRCPTYM